MRAPVDAPRATPHGAYAYWRAKSQRRHAGVDLGGKRGTRVVAPEEVRVLAVLRAGALASDPSVRGVGLRGYEPEAVLARGASGMVHVLGHLEGVDVDVGDLVAEGGRVGVISGARHVHWEVRKPDAAPWPRSSRLADTVDPLAWLLSGSRTSSSSRGLAAWADAAQALSDDVRALATRRAAGEVVLVLVGLAILAAHGKPHRR